ncbi:hypothetical protein ASG31_17580 [Chryseobacterium sp. Leaf404]|uniref:hypothetical protein n=1 Tax=unclassified Chryseobacterium TaxID=2593645 RepID=UPI0006F57D3E|nr:MULTISPECIES: hypothetical protein [unclassified Chryseobacterium]KQT20579.1 hypothetical protein ASG31_17580 [Chryseobacterium sp. Leaf404]
MIALVISCETEKTVIDKAETKEKISNPSLSGKLTAITIDNNIVIAGPNGDLYPSKEEIRTVLTDELAKAGVTTNYGEMTILREMTDAGEVIALRANDFDNGVKTTIFLQATEDGKFRLAPSTGTCSCKSKACATSIGCTAEMFGTNCTCTSCSGDCEKTSTASFGEALVAHLSSDLD